MQWLCGNKKKEKKRERENQSDYNTILTNPFPISILFPVAISSLTLHLKLVSYYNSFKETKMIYRHLAVFNRTVPDWGISKWQLKFCSLFKCDWRLLLKRGIELKRSRVAPPVAARSENNKNEKKRNERNNKREKNRGEWRREKKINSSTRWWLLFSITQLMPLRRAGFG